MTDTTTALAVLPAHTHWGKINEIRSKHDRANPRWMPHINFIFPFVPTDLFPAVKKKLEDKLVGFKSFKLNLNKIGYFSQGKNVTVHLAPEDSTKLAELFDIIKSVLPDVKIKHDTFHPHITLAQFKKSELPTKLKELEEWLGEGFLTDVNCINFLSRSKDDSTVQFSIHETINLS